MLRAPLNLALSVPSDGAFTASLHSLCQASPPSLDKNTSSSDQSQIELLQFAAMPPSPLATGPAEHSVPIFPQGPSKSRSAAVRPPRGLLSSRLSNPNSLSLSSEQRGSSPRSISGASSALPPTAPGPSCAQEPRAGDRDEPWRGCSFMGSSGEFCVIHGKELNALWRRGVK